MMESNGSHGEHPPARAENVPPYNPLEQLSPGGVGYGASQGEITSPIVPDPEQPDTPNIPTEVTETVSSVNPVEAPSRPVTITHRVDVHGRSRDIVTNNRHPDQPLAAYAAAAIKDGIADDLNVMPRVHNPQEAPNDKAWYSDADRTIFIKMRGYTAETYPHHRRYISDRTGSRARHNADELAILRAQYSTLNEIAIAEEVGAIVEQDTRLQEFVQGHDFAGLSVVQPLAATVDHRGQRIMAYPYVNGSGYGLGRDEDPDTASPTFIRVSQVVDFLRDRLEDRGISPADLDPRQIIIGPDNRLNLVDMEQYYHTLRDPQ